jgi:hypothetical protein
MVSMDRVLTRVSGKSIGLFAVCLAAAIPTACAGKALDVGDDSTAAGTSSGNAQAGSSTQSASGGTGPGATGHGAASSGATAPGALTDDDLANIQWPAAEACNPAPSSPLVGTWKGRFPYNNGESEEAVLTITGLTSDGLPCGTFRVGQGKPPPPPTDPEAIYPEEFPSGYQTSYGGRSSYGGVGNPIIDPWPGFEYELLKVISEGSRLAFMLSFDEILRPWCQMQPSYPGSFSCLPEWTSGSADGNGNACTISGPSLAPTQVPCWKMQYCSSYTCFCYEGECDAALNMTAFELHWDGAALEGTVNGGTNLIFLDPI